MIIGKQVEGSSPPSIKSMALRAFSSVAHSKYGVIADVGAGSGQLTQQLLSFADKIIMLDEYQSDNLPSNVVSIKSDLNQTWGIEDNSIDFLFSLEVVEHVENPRHFFREIKRVLKPGGIGFVSTPNNLNVFSKMLFLLTGCHRYFQDNCYPAHISVLTEIDLKRILNENNLALNKVYYNYEDALPLLGMSIKWKLPSFSNSTGVLFSKR